MRKISSDIVAKLWNLCNVLKDDGVTHHQYVTELTYLLFLKMEQETGIASGNSKRSRKSPQARNHEEAPC